MADPEGDPTRHLDSQDDALPEGLIFLFDYSIRRSRRARRLRIVVRPDRSVEVVLPLWVAKRHAHAFVSEQREWVARSLLRFTEQAAENVCSQPFPDNVELPAIQCSFRVTYKRSESERVRVVESGDELHLSGAIDDRVMVGEALRRWLRQKAKGELVPMLESLAQQHRFRHRRVTIRLQKSRWGSCSKSGSISLNARLLFLPPELTRYVILHELAHLERMDHSPAFWAVVARCDPDYLDHRRQLRKRGGQVPRWSEA